MAGFRLRLITGTAVALTGAVCAGTALADTRLGWYVAAEGGQDLSSSQALKITDVTLTSSNAGATAPAAGTYTLKPDYAAEGFARAGYRFTPNLRAEVEVGTRPGTVINGLGSNRTADLGAFDKTSLMANAIFDLRPDLPIHPFIGVGAGVVRVKTGYSETDTAGGHTFSYAMAGDKTVPAGQILAGASWDVTQSLHFDMTYRYLRTASTSYDVAMSDAHGAATDTWTAKAAGPIKDQSLSVGLRWTFGGSSAPPPSYSDAPPPARAQHAGLHFPALSLPFTRSHKTATAAPAPAAPVTVAQADPAPQASAAQASVAPPAPAAAIPAQPDAAAPQVQPGEADTAPGSDAAATAGEPKRFFATSARAPGKGSSKAPVHAPSQPSQTPVSAPVQPQAEAQDAPPSEAAAPAAKARHFTAYFPLGGAKLDDRAQAVVSDAAQHAQSAPDAHVNVDGYADTSGSAAYNMGLSRRRATAVADALKAGGVAEDTITVAWHGETHLAVKTHDGVRNARNRRVTIGVHFGTAKAKTHHRHHRRHRHHR